MSLKKILVTGATGKQGGSVVTALLSANTPSPAFEIIALTRNPESGSGKALASKPNVSVIQGDLDDTKAIFEKAGGVGSVWGVFKAQGKALADAAFEYGVKFFVYLSVDRGGQVRLQRDERPHFISKARVEQKVKEIGEKGVGWTILRPVAFFDNTTPDFTGAVTGSLWKIYVSPNRKVQLVATSDIGYSAALAFKNPDEWNHRCLSLAGDDLTFPEADAIFRETIGKPLPTTYSVLAYGISWMVQELRHPRAAPDVYIEGYGANIAELKRLNPGLKDFRTWLKTESALAKPQ